MKRTLVSHYSPQTRARARRERKVQKILLSAQAPLVFVTFFFLYGAATLMLLNWLRIVQ